MQSWKDKRQGDVAAIAWWCLGLLLVYSSPAAAHRRNTCGGFASNNSRKPKKGSVAITDGNLPCMEIVVGYSCCIKQKLLALKQVGVLMGVAHMKQLDPIV